MELSLLDIEGDAATFLGDYDHAIRCFSEIWRLSMQMNIPRSALFAAKRKGDLEIMKAVMAMKGEESNQEKTVMHRKMLSNAIYTYMEEGHNVATKLSDKEWLWLFCIQQLRAICMQLKSYSDSRTPGADTEKLIQMGIEDIEKLEASDWAKALPKSYDLNAPLEDLVDCYYVTPYVCYFRHLCELLSDKKLLPKMSYRFEHPLCISGAIRYGSKFKDDDMGEKQRKMDGIKTSTIYGYTNNDPMIEYDTFDIDEIEPD